jgi:membrane-associated phospholipid phosphatase
VLVVSATGLAAIWLTAAVRGDDLLVGELGLMRWLGDHTPPGVDVTSAALDVAFTEYAAPVVFAALVLAAWWRWGARVALVFLAAGSLTGLTKVADLAARPRPTAELEWSAAVHGEGGYPSGHVVYAVVVFGFLVHLARRHEPPGPARRALVVTLVLLVLASGPARLVERDHWPADVLAGYLLAVPLLGAAIWFERRAALVAAAWGTAGSTGATVSSAADP